MAEKFLQQVLRHAPVGQVLRDGVAEKVRVDIFRNAGFLCNLLYDLLHPAPGVVCSARRGEDVAAFPAGEVQPELVGEAAKDRDVARFAALIDDADLEFGHGEVFRVHAAEGADPAAGFKQGPDVCPAKAGVFGRS